METKVTMLLTLPYRHGGFGLPMPDLNAKVRPVKTAARSASKRYFFCDLFWPDLNVSVEYDSDRHHKRSEDLARDAMKRNSLVSVDVATITVTKLQLYNVSEFEKTAMHLAATMGRRLQYKKPEFYQKHQVLRDSLGL